MTDTIPTIRERLGDLRACPAGIQALAAQGFDLDSPDPGVDQWVAWWRAWQSPGHPMRAHAGWIVGRLVPVARIREDLAGADLRHAYLRRAAMDGADLTGADLRGAYLAGADLRGADLAGADLRGVDLRETGLRRASLADADMEGADLRHAYLRGADLTGSDLRRVDLRGADLRRTDLRWADLTGAYRHPTDPAVPGWTVVDYRLHRDTTETS